MKNQHEQGRRDGDFILSTPTEIESELPFQLFGAGYNFYQYSVDRPFGFPVFQWIQTTKGSGILEINGKIHEIDNSAGMLLYPNEAHSYHAVDDYWYVHWISFGGHNVPDMLNYIEMKETGVYQLSHHSTIEVLILKALQILKSTDSLHRLDGSSVVYSILLSFLKYLEKNTRIGHSSAIRRLQPALDLIEKELDKPLSLNDMARAVGITPQYFCELFKLIVDQRPMEYLNQRRVDKAKELMIRNPKIKIHDISRQVGFHSDSYFGTVFRRFEGTSPRNFRFFN
ncbi:MAG: AraC family transcriptional regulator [Salinispira sp.]